MVSGKRGCTHWGRLRWLGARSGSGEVGSAVGFGDVPKKELFFFSLLILHLSMKALLVSSPS